MPKAREFYRPKYKGGDMVTMHTALADQDPEDPCPDEVGEVEGGAEGWDYEKGEPEECDKGRWPDVNQPDAAQWIMYVVTVPKRLRTDPEDYDGMREVSEDQMSYYRPVGNRRK
jgi:hypothetical protein